MTFGLPSTFRKNLRRYIARDYFALDGPIVTGRTLTPAPGTCTIVDTETCLSILPNVGASLANQVGVTFGG